MLEVLLVAENFHPQINKVKLAFSPSQQLHACCFFLTFFSPTLKLLFLQGAPFSYTLCDTFSLLLPHLCFSSFSVKRTEGGKQLKRTHKSKIREKVLLILFLASSTRLGRKKTPNTFSFQILEEIKTPLFNQREHWR